MAHSHCTGPGTGMRLGTTGLCIFTARKRSCGKVMFLQVSVILSTGGGAMCGCRGWSGGGHAWLQGVCLVVGGMHGCGGHA